MSNNLVKYEEFSIEEAEREMKELGEGPGNEFMKLTPGRHVVRFLPPLASWGRKTCMRIVFQHFVEVPGVQNSFIFVCPRIELKKRCLACERSEQLNRTGNPIDGDAAYQMRAQRRVFANVINRADEERGPLVLSFGKGVEDDLMKIRLDKVAGGDYTHPERGFDIVINRTGTGKKDTRYDVKAARESSPLGNMMWIEQQHDLNTYARIKAPEDMEKILDGEVPERGERGQQRALPAASQPSRAQPAAQPAQVTTRQPRRRTAEDDIAPPPGDNDLPDWAK